MGVASRFFFALVFLLRFSVNVGFFERPLTVGLVWACITGDWELALSLSIFYELFWLDLFPAGTYIPPNAVTSLLLGLGVASYYSLTEPSQLAIPVALSLPFAMLSSQVEYLQRRLQNRSYNGLIQWGRSSRRSGDDEGYPGRLVAKALLQLFSFSAIYFLFSLLVLIGTISLIISQIGYLPELSGVVWGHFWFVGCLGGVLSLRVRKSYLVCASMLLLSIVSHYII